jgi:hypothetical protein
MSFWEMLWGLHRVVSIIGSWLIWKLYAYADLAIVLVVSWAWWVVEAGKRISVGVRDENGVCALGPRQDSFAGQVRPDPTNPVPPHGELLAFS